MKKISALVIVAALALTLMPAFTASAQISAYDTCFQVQNLSSSTASLVISYYDQGTASAVAEVSDTVAASGSNTYCPLDAVSAGFNGSVVIASDQEVAAIVNVTGGGWSAYNASYAGFSSGATSVNIPLLMKDNYGYNTWFNVQNVGSGTANITVNYSDGTSDTASIDPNLAVTFDQALESHSQAVFAATVTSTNGEPIVVTVMEVGPTMLFSYDGFTNDSVMPVMPLFQANNYGYTSGIQLQNTGGTDTSVTVSYTPSSSGTACEETLTIVAGESATFGILAFDAGDTAVTNDCVNGETFVGSAQVTANSASQPLVGIVNQHAFGDNKGAAYGAFNPDAATDTVVLPLIMDRNFGYFTGFNIMNVGTSATSVNCTFTGSSYTAGASLDPGEALTDVQLNNVADGYTGSAVCTATGGDASIVGVVNELGGGSGDTLLVYEGFNAGP